jgi:hypothetical protein
MKTTRIHRREFLELAGLTGAGIAGVIFTSRLRRADAIEKNIREKDFLFL